MAEASDVTLAGFLLRPDAKIVRWPDRYMDERRREFLGREKELLPVQIESLVTGGSALDLGGSTFSSPSTPFSRLAFWWS